MKKTLCTILLSAFVLAGCDSTGGGSVLQSSTSLAAPSAVADNFQVAPNQTLNQTADSGLFTNDQLNLATLSAFDTASAQGGTVSVLTDGSFSYTPALDFVGTDSFTYTLDNGSGQSQAIVSLTVSQDAVASLASVAAGGGSGDGNSDSSRLVPDGRFVVFDSGSNDLVTGDGNNNRDIFRFDRELQRVERLSLDSAGGEGDGGSFDPHLSSDGRFLVFQSDASNLVAGDNNGESDIFLRDLQSGTIERVSLSSAGAEGDDDSGDPIVSDDGQLVIFESEASTLVPSDTNGEQDLFLRDLGSNTITRISLAPGGGESDDNSRDPRGTPDLSCVVFESPATNLVAGDANARTDVFLWERATGIITLVSVTAGGVQGEDTSDNPAISADGRFVAFETSSSSLLATDTNDTDDIYVKDLSTGALERISVASDGTQGDMESENPDISGDGRFVVFQSLASTLDPNHPNGFCDIFVHDRQTGTTARVNATVSGSEPNGESVEPSISRDGRFISFETEATNFTQDEDNNASGDIVVVANPLF